MNHRGDRGHTVRASAARRVVVVCALLAQATSAQTQTAPTAAPLADTLPLAERMRIVTEMDAFTRKHFAHWSALDGQSYDSMVTAFRTAAERAPRRRAFDMAALAFVAGLRNGHTRFSDRWLQQTLGQPLWLWIWPHPSGWLITDTEFPGLMRGDVITHVNEAPVETVYLQARPYLMSSGERMRRYSVTQDDYLWPLTSRLTLADGRTVSVTRGIPTDSAVRASRAGAPLVPHRWLVRDSIAYVRITRFSPRSYEDSAVAVLTRLYAQAPVLIVDVRGNGGGSTPRKLISMLQANRGGRRLELIKSTIGADTFRFLAALQPSGGGAPYRGALVVLADHRCASACEDFLAPFADSKHALVIGDTTWGSSGQPQFLDLGHGMQYQVSARRYRLANGAPFEGVGIPPHIVVPLSADALRAGRDLVLERALAEIRAGRAPVSPP